MLADAPQSERPHTLTDDDWAKIKVHLDENPGPICNL